MPNAKQMLSADIKKLLVELAINDKLPADFNEFDKSLIDDIIEKSSLFAAVQVCRHVLNELPNTKIKHAAYKNTYQVAAAIDDLFED